MSLPDGLDGFSWIQSVMFIILTKSEITDYNVTCCDGSWETSEVLDVMFPRWRWSSVC